jgi:hypothetical protein
MRSHSASWPAEVMTGTCHACAAWPLGAIVSGKLKYSTIRRTTREDPARRSLRRNSTRESSAGGVSVPNSLVRSFTSLRTQCLCSPQARQARSRSSATLQGPASKARARFVSGLGRRRGIEKTARILNPSRHARQNLRGSAAIVAPRSVGSNSLPRGNPEEINIGWFASLFIILRTPAALRIVALGGRNVKRPAKAAKCRAGK